MFSFCQQMISKCFDLYCNFIESGTAARFCHGDYKFKGTSFGESLKNFGFCLTHYFLFVLLLLLLLFLFLGFLALLTKSVVSTRSRLDSVTGAGNQIQHVNYQRCLCNSSLTQMTKLATFMFPWNCCLQWVVWKAASSQTELSSAGST